MYLIVRGTNTGNKYKTLKKKMKIVKYTPHFFNLQNTFLKFYLFFFKNFLLLIKMTFTIIIRSILQNKKYE